MLPTMNLKQYASFSKLLLLCAVLLLNPVHSLGASRDTLPDSSASKQRDVACNAHVLGVSPSPTTSFVQEKVQEKQSSSSSGLVYVLLVIQILWILLSIFVYLQKIRPIIEKETSGSDSAKRSQGSETRTQKKPKNNQVDNQEKKIIELIKTELKTEILRLEKGYKALEKRVQEVEQRPDDKQDGNTDDPKSPPQTSSAQGASASTGETKTSVISMQEPHTSEPTYLYIGRIPASTFEINLDSSKPSPCYFQVKVTGNGKAELSLCDGYRSEGEKGGIENNLRGCGLIEIEGGGGNGSSFELVNWGTGTIQNNRFTMDTPIKYKRKG